MLNCLCNAEDLLLLSESKEGLQSCLESLQANCDSWKLKVNISKTKVILVSNGKLDTKAFKFTLNGSEIEMVYKYIYLGTLSHHKIQVPERSCLRRDLSSTFNFDTRS